MPPPTKERLTREKVIDAALKVMDAEGLEAVSMRRVGRELGVEAMSLYNHIADKDALLDGIVEAVMARFQFPESSSDQMETARRAARAWRDLLRAHPHVMVLLSDQRKPLTSLAALRPMEYALGIIGDFGLSQEETARAFHAFGGYIQGFVMAEITGMFGSEDIQVHPEDFTSQIPAEEFPNLIAAMPYLFECHFDTDFEYGLDLMLRGLMDKISH